MSGVGALEVPEEEDLALQDGPAQTATVDALVELGALRTSRVVEERIGVERAVAEELEGVAVELVCAGAGYDFDLRAATAAQLGLAAVGDDADFFNRVGIGRRKREPKAGHDAVVDVDAVQARVV